MRVDNHEQPHVLLNTDFCANTRVTSIDGGVRVVIRTDIRGWLRVGNVPPAYRLLPNHRRLRIRLAVVQSVRSC